ncbi:cyclin-dependent kinase-like 3 [Scomber scombrus]|uniref:cyclin-dependent kinase-like 3 n=1 Tax=Scomber scombrus TaxID=13677 RepID=UPI002DD86819|nr:cyclin-dependent kinase-like 3 [Scomber scombrus]
MERYESLGLVGEGSYGTVLKCRHRDSGRLVAIKKFMDSDDDKTVKKIALREIKLLRQLRHDNLVNLLEVWKRRRRWYLVFEFVERTLLDDLEQNPNGLDLNTSRQHLYQILRATAFCHQQNIIHRDIKPENILISQGGVVKLCDFGFARIMASPAEGGIYTDYVATRWYRAPELLVGDTKYGKPVDVWAVGCLLIEMLTGQPLFPGDSDLDQIYHVVRFFGNLTAHHQELFYRNPVFSGVRLPECPGKIPLEQRFSTITPTALDLAQDCLQMDPERRAQCSELLEHPLFTNDSFQIRFLDELNAKIQKDHRENSTLPKITKAPKRERDEEDERNQRGKDKKQSEDLEVKVMKEKEKRDKKEEEKMEKTKGKQPSKLSKTNRNPSEPLMSTKQSKTSGAKVFDNAAKTTVTTKSKLGKPTGAQLRKELEISKLSKTSKSDSEATKTATDLKDNNAVAAKSKHGNVASTEPMGDHLKNMDIKHIDYRCSESSQEFGKNCNNTDTKVPKTLKSLTTDNPNGSSFPKPRLESVDDGTETNITLKTVSKNDHNIATPPTMSKAFNMTSTSEHQTDRSTMGTEQRKASDCPKASKKSVNPERNDTTNTATIADMTSIKSTMTPDHRPSSRSSVFHSNMDSADIHEFNISEKTVPPQSPPPPPPPPSSTPLLLPPSSTPLMTSIGTRSPALSDHLSLGSRLHPGTHSLRSIDKPRYHGGIYSRLTQQSLSNHITGSLTAQVLSEMSVTSERSFLSNRSSVAVPKRKLDIHFPDLRSSVLPELRGREDTFLALGEVVVVVVVMGSGVLTGKILQVSSTGEPSISGRLKSNGEGKDRAERGKKYDN